MPTSPDGPSPPPSGSSPGVSVTWLDRDAARRAAERAARQVAAEHPEVIGVLMYGSVARGDAVPGSDVDLLVVLGHSDRPFLDRLGHYPAPSLDGLAVDVLAYTTGELARLRDEPGIVRAALAEGVWVVGQDPEKPVSRGSGGQ